MVNERVFVVPMIIGSLGFIPIIMFEEQSTAVIYLVPHPQATEKCTVKLLLYVTPFVTEY